jgi:hypothetical protein
MNEKIEFEKSAWRVWLLALLGVPLLLIGADFFFEQKLIEFLRKLIYGAEELGASDPRDRILASLFIVVGAVLTLWGLKELIFPKKVLVADRAGLHLAVTGPFQRAALVPWEVLTDVEYEVIDDEGDERPVIRVEVTDRSVFPDHPWGARWTKPGAILIDATRWSPPASDVVELLWQFRKSMQVGTADEG